jgi:uncharacterized protein
MVTVPAEGRWSLRSLADDDIRAALHFLRRDPLINVYLISRLEEERAVAATQMFSVRYNGDIVVVASLATNIVLAADANAPRAITDAAIALIADRILTRMIPVRAIISPADLVERLWEGIRSRFDPPTVVRMTQPIYAIRRQLGFPDLDKARFATLGDLDELVPACASMHKEEVGIDPLERDAVGYRERIRELIERRRAVIRIEKGMIASKCEFSAVTDEAAQLMGVWTHPRFRRQGLAGATLQEVCGHLFRKGKTVTLFVNDFNLPAIHLYERLGFRRIGTNRALIW